MFYCVKKIHVTLTLMRGFFNDDDNLAIMMKQQITLKTGVCWNVWLVQSVNRDQKTQHMQHVCLSPHPHRTEPSLNPTYNSAVNICTMFCMFCNDMQSKAQDTIIQQCSINTIFLGLFSFTEVMMKKESMEHPRVVPQTGWHLLSCFTSTIKCVLKWGLSTQVWKTNESNPSS